MRRPLRSLLAVGATALLALTAAACERETSTPSAGPGASAPSTTAPDDRLATEPGCEGTGSTAQRDIRYRTTPGVAANLQSLDLYTPVRPASCGPAPLVVYVHGGAFSAGDKANSITDKVRLFTSEGWSFASVNYRLSPRPASTDPGRVMHPTHSQDIAAAVGWLVDHAAANGIDPDRLVLMGHSAGAFLAALVATDERFLAADGVTLDQVPCAAPLDTRYDIVAELASGGGPTAGVMYRNAFGDDPAVWADASPITHTTAKKGMPDFLVVVQGGAARVKASEDFAAAIRLGQSRATVLNANPLDHEGVNRAVGRTGDTIVTPALMTFLRTCLDPDAPRPRR